jgi:hypothetical protein
MGIRPRAYLTLGVLHCAAQIHVNDSHVDDLVSVNTSHQLVPLGQRIRNHPGASQSGSGRP